jgi:predicted small lipoprotein YifL
MNFIRTARVWALVIAMLTALAGCGYAEEPVDNSSAAEKPIYTDCHIHILSKPMAEVFIVLNGSDKFSENQIEEFSSERILSLLNEGKLDRAFILSGSYILGQDGIEGPDEYNM